MRRVLFTSESVTEGHPDKICDRISDAVLDAIIKEDPMARVACETFVTTGIITVMGEITTTAYVDIEKIARECVCDIGYDRGKYGFDGRTCGVLVAVHGQSPDIALGVDRCQEDKEGTMTDGLNTGAGDQGMMFGYATDETENYMPLTLDLAHTLVYTLARVRKEGKEMLYLRPDSKSQVTIEYSEQGEPLRIDTIVVSTQHDEDATQEQIKEDVRRILLPRVAKRDARYEELLKGDFKLLVNPTGNFVIGGPHGDTGLTGRKIIVDTYGGRGAHGGGAFSGKDPSKVDRSAAYAARWIAKNMVAAGVAKEMLVQISYAIGVAKPVSVCVNTYGTAKVAMSDGEIAQIVNEMFDLRPQGIIEALKLKQPMYEETARYGHMGRTNEVVTKTFVDNGQTIEREVELFTWEKLDRIEEIKKAFSL